MLRGELLRLLVLCTALLATAARAVHLGEPGVGSQYQLFGRPITDTSAIHSHIGAGSTAVPTTTPAQVLAVEDDAQRSGATKANADAARKCEADYLYSDVFGKCLPAPGKDGYIGAAEHEKGKGKSATSDSATSDSAFVPIGSVAGVNMHMPLPLRTIPMQHLPLRTAALHQPSQPQPQPLLPQQPTPPAQPGGQPARAEAPVRQLRLACPAGFTFQPAMGTCIAPAQAMFGGPQAQQMQPMRMRRGDDDDDDSDDDLRRELMMRARHRMFGRRFGGGPRILAPVFVFVLPPNALDRNATMRLGQHFGRVHEVHPSLVGGGTQRERDAATSPSAPAPAEKPTTKPATPAETDKPKGAVIGTGSGTGAGGEPPKALRGAFVNPIVSGKALPLKAGDSESQAQPQPLMATEERIALPALKRRADFISPFVAVAPTHNVGAV